MDDASQRSVIAPPDAREAPRVVRPDHRSVGALSVPGRPASSLPVIVHDMGVRGPTVVVTANLHGDEATGLGVVRRLDAWLREHPYRGRLVLYPSCNPEGLRARERTVPGTDDVDLNRVFPGRASGDPGVRLAHRLWSDLSAREPDAVVDLHADAPRAIPYVIVDRPVRLAPSERRALSRRLLTLARATGLTVLREYPEDVYVQFGLDRSLAGAVVNLLGVPAVTLEVGPRRFEDPAAVEVAWRATQGVLRELGVIETPAWTHPSRVDGTWRRASSPRARRGGRIEPLLEPGDVFRRGDGLARLVDLRGELVEVLRAPDAGVLVSWAEETWIAAGGVVGTLGVPDRERL